MLLVAASVVARVPLFKAIALDSVKFPKTDLVLLFNVPENPDKFTFLTDPPIVTVSVPDRTVKLIELLSVTPEPAEITLVPVLAELVNSIKGVPVTV